jgi:pyruvate kinase
MPITVLTTRASTARQCYGWLKGCTAKLMPKIDKTEEVVRETINEYKAAGLVYEGEPFVIVHGYSANVGATNTMKIEYA